MFILPDEYDYSTPTPAEVLDMPRRMRKPYIRKADRWTVPATDPFLTGEPEKPF